MTIPRIAVKRLTPSDLTLFKWHYENRRAGNQKAINLNANVFVAELYPILPTVAVQFDGRFSVDTYLYGPGLAGEYNLQRKIIKTGAYKNWRLDGEFIPNPEGDPTRFDSLEADDLVVLEFSGASESYPTAVRAVFLSQNNPTDQTVRLNLLEWLDQARMATISTEKLGEVVEASGLHPEHPLRSIGLDSVMESAAMGGDTRELMRRRGGRRISRTEFKRAKDAAEAIGRLGEEYVDVYLRSLGNAIGEYTWDSDQNAISPYDFRIIENGGTLVRIDVKTTSGDFERPIHISIAELLEMVTGEGAYRLYRVFDAGQSGAKLRISGDMRAFAEEVLSALSHLPRGVSSDSISVSPNQLDFPGAVISIEPWEDDE